MMLIIARRTKAAAVKDATSALFAKSPGNFQWAPAQLLSPSSAVIIAYSSARKIGERDKSTKRRSSSSNSRIHRLIYVAERIQLYAELHRRGRLIRIEFDSPRQIIERLINKLRAGICRECCVGKCANELLRGETDVRGLRRQMIHGARAVMCRLAKHNDRRSQWLKELAARRGFNRALVALANKTARIAWVLLARKEEYVAA